MKSISTSKLVKNIQLLSETEFKEVGKWLNSPWANSNKRLIHFHKILMACYPSFTSVRCSRERLEAKLFPSQRQSDKLLRNLMSELNRQIEQFLIHQQLREDKYLQKILLRNDYFKRKQFSKFSTLSKSIIKERKKKQVSDWDDYLQLALLHEKLYFQPVESIRYNPDPDALIQLDDNLGIFYALGKFRIVHELLQRKALLRKTVKTKPEYVLLEYLNEHIQHPAIQLYFSRISRPEDWNFAEYYQFKLDLFKVFDQLPEKEKKVFLYAALNDTVVLNSKGDLKANSEMLELYKFGLQQDLFLHNNTITGTTYANIILIANSLKDHSFVNVFIEEYSKKLPDDIRTEAFQWGKAQTLYSLENPSDCIEVMRGVDYTYPTFALLSRSTLLKAYFDLECFENSTFNFQFFESFCKSFEKYIRRISFLSKDRKEAFLRYIQHSLKLTDIPGMRDKERIKRKEQIRKRIEKEDNIFGKLWLLSKLEAL